MKQHEWVVYGAFEGTKVQYIGKTGDLSERSAYHRFSAAWWSKCTIRIMRRARSEGMALRIEERLIKRYRPPYNVHHNPARDREGALPFDEARRIWHENATLTHWALMAQMPGWTVDRARRAFGPQKRMLIWRRPRVVDGPALINAKLYRIAYHPEPRRTW